MKTTTLFSWISASVFILALPPAAAQNVTRGADVRGADVKGADVQGGSVTGGSVTGGSVTGGSVTGGTVTGGSVTGGSVTGGTVTPGSVTPGTVTASAGGREIRVRATGSVSVNTRENVAEVKIGDQVLLIEKERLLLDGERLADLPAAAKKLEVEVQDRRLRVTADGKQVTDKALNSSHDTSSGPDSPASADTERVENKARSDAERARSEGDRLRAEAEKIREEAERLRQQADRLRNQ
jgi:hypothetical protein